MEVSMVANLLGLLMWSTENIHQDRLVDRLVVQLSTMEQRPHENHVLVAKCNVQYSWFRSKLKEQCVIKKEEVKLNAHIAVEEGKDFDALVGQVMESR